DDAGAYPPLLVGIGHDFAVGAAVVALADAVVEDDVRDGHRPPAPPHAVIRITPAARLANRHALNRTPIVIPQASPAPEHSQREPPTTTGQRGRLPAVLARNGIVLRNGPRRGWGGPSPKR